MSLHRSSTTALGAARQAMQLSGPQRSARVSQLRPRPSSCAQVDAEVASLVGPRAGPGARAPAGRRADRERSRRG